MTFSEYHQKWIDQFLEWARPRNDIRAAMIFGSQAKKGGSLSDDWSDLDIAIFTSKPRLYTKNNSWMREISPMWAGLMDTNEVWNGVAAASGFSVYEGGVIVDPIIVPIAKAHLAILCILLLNWRPSVWRQTDHPIVNFCREMSGFFRRGVIVLFDKDGLTQRLAKIAESIPQYASPPPSSEKFRETADSFWVDPPRVVASLRQGKLVWAMRSFTPMFGQIFNMAEWHTQAKHGWDNGQQYRPKMIEKWADPFIVESLSQVYPRYVVDDIWRALIASMNLYRRLTVETAALLAYDYDIVTAETICAWVEECHKETTR